MHEKNYPNKDEDRIAHKLQQEKGSMRKAAKSDKWNKSKSALARRAKRYKDHLDGEYSYPQDKT